MFRSASVFTLLVLASSVAVAEEDNRSVQGDAPRCQLSQTLVASIQHTLAAVVKLQNGGIFTPNRMWSAVVDREGHLCAVDVVGDAWPGSRAIAIDRKSVV